MLAVILVGQLQDRLARLLAKPDNRTPDQLIVPLAARNEPRMADTGQLVSRRQVDHHLRVRMVLQERGWHLIRDLTLHGLGDHARLIVAKRHQHDRPGIHHRRDTHRDQSRRHLLLRREGT